MGARHSESRNWRLLLTGASGYLGAHLAPRAAKLFDVYSTYFSNPERITAGVPLYLDLSNPDAVRQMLYFFQPEAIVHTAASNRDGQNMAAIVPVARALAEYAREAGIRLIHLSTDLVFDGDNPPYHDDSPLSPIMSYGAQKAEAETLVREIYPAATIVRPSLIYGLDPLDAQTRWLVEGMRGGETVSLFTDEYRCPIWVDALVDALIELIDVDCPGPIHLVGPQSLNRWDFGLKLLAALNVPRSPNVIPATVAESGLVRSKNLTLTAERAEQLLKTHLPGVDEVLLPRTTSPLVELPLPDQEHRTRKPRYCEG